MCRGKGLDQEGYQVWSKFFCAQSRRSWPVALKISCWHCQQTHTDEQAKTNSQTHRHTHISPCFMSTSLNDSLLSWGSIILLTAYMIPTIQADRSFLSPSFDSVTKSMMRRISDVFFCHNSTKMVYSYPISHLKIWNNTRLCFIKLKPLAPAALGQSEKQK